MTSVRDTELPGYLMEWPRLRGEKAIDDFARLYKLQQKKLNEDVIQKRASASAQLATVDDFHRKLKAVLGQ